MGSRVNAATRAVIVTATGIALSFGLGGLALSGVADAATPYLATNAVNVRSGPGTSYPVLGVLSVGDAVSGTAAGNGWVKVSYRGATGYVYGDYLKKSTSATPPTSGGTAATKVTTVNVNLRTAPSLDSTVVRVLAKGTAVTTTGRTSGDFSEVTVDGVDRWLYTAYLASTGSSSKPAPTIKYKARTTALLAMRKKPAIDAPSAGDLKAGTEVSLTGTYSGSYSQIVWKKAEVWILSGYLASIGEGPSAPPLPTAAGKRYVTAGELNIRATSAADSKVVDTVSKGTVLLITGVTAGDRSQVIFDGALRWASTGYLSKTKPSAEAPAPEEGSLGSASLDRTNPYAKAIVRLIRKEFPAIKTIYGWRMSSAYSSDHPSGRALDIMIPKYSTASGKALGDKIARYLQQNHKKLHVHYLIWRQRNWNVERNLDFTKGWRTMADRGGATANHYDHVHVSVYD
ncbi:MAG: SH3 domain-containing protein [Micropruina sp.]|uniref:SH3 domain-containing protein n=1 Tax=Micropruina sp. TaxID=2737536 RepID=UPI0039E36C78